MNLLASFVRDEDEAAVVAMTRSLADGPLSRMAGATIEIGRAALVDAGLWGVSLPEDVGGGGADPHIAGLVTTVLGGAWPACGFAFVQAQAVGALLAHSPAMASLLTEVSAGTTVVLGALPADQTWSVGAQLHLPRVDTTAAPCTLAVLIDDHRAAVVPPERARLHDVVDRSGLDGATTTAASFIAAEDLLVSDIDAAACRAVARVGFAQLAAGLMARATDLADDYVRARHQFGGPLGDLPVVRQALLQCRAASLQALAAALTPVVDPEVARAVASRNLDGAIDVAANAVQRHGGYGYLDEYEVSRLLRDAMSLRAAAQTV